MRSLYCLLMLVLLGSCSSISDLDLTSARRSDYESYLDRNLQSEKLFLKLRETASAKALLVTAELAQLQSQVVPGFELLPQEGKTLFVVSLEMPDWSRFSISDFKFYFGESASKTVKEIMDSQLLQTLYPFAVPHDRAFIVEFEVPTTPGILKIQTSQGQFLFPFGEGT